MRHWRLATLFFGIELLWLGSIVTPAPDWDFGVSVLMAVTAYFTAPFVLDVVVKRDWVMLPLALFLTWLTVDGVYAVYWYLVDPTALVMRGVQWPLSTVLFCLVGLLWRKWK